MSDEIEEIPSSQAVIATTTSSSTISNNNNSRVRVCVTGATGFIASHLVYQLLLKGYIVHGTVRSMPKGRDELYKALLAYDQSQDGKKQLSEEMLKERLICFESDLLKEGSFAEAIKGCQFVQHTASPFKITVKDPQLDLVDPAVKGTRNVLGECIKLRESQSNEDPNRLQRIILTSSIASIVDTPLPDKIYNEGDWNEVSNLNKNPYFFSKVMAEKAAWSLMKEAEEKHGKGFLELVTICPAAVIGKPIFDKQVNTSHESIIMLANGGFPALFAIGFVFVDVKDVGLAHLLAMEYQKEDRTTFTPSKMERYIVCCDESTTMKQLVEILKEQFTNPPHKWVKNLPSRSMEGKFGCAIAKMGSIFQPKGVRDYMQSNLGKPLYFNNKKIKDAFGMTFVDTKTQVKESTEYLLNIGQIKQ